MNNKTRVSLLLILIMLLTSACGGNINANVNKANDNISEMGDFKYGINMLVIHQDESYLPLYQQLKQSLVVGLKVKSLQIDNISTENLEEYDMIYLALSKIENNQIKKFKSAITKYVEQGGNLVMPLTLKENFTGAFTGLGKKAEVNVNQKPLVYPELGEDIKGIQQVAQAFETDYKKFINKELIITTAKTRTAKAVIAYEDGALLSVNKYKKGKVIVLSDFLPNYTQYITGFDLIPRGEENNYFQFFYATGNYQMLNELVTYVAKDRDGLAFKKVMGSYGRPAMAWQNHYEAMEAIANKELSSWIDILKEYDQIPSISLVRGSYDWGEWYNTITYHLNIGDNNKPKFMGEEENSYYTSGVYIENTNNQTMTLGKYPESVSYYSKIEKNFRPYPYFVDWNSNGKIDIIVGSHDGRVGLIENVGSREKPIYKEVVYLKTVNGQEINIGENASPTLLDYNHNGKLDIIVGNKAGEVFVLKNTGNGFTNPQPLNTEKGERIVVSSEAAPFAGDLNGDGITDLVIGNKEGNVYLFEGVKGQQLSFKEGKKILVEGKKELQVDAFSAPHIGDFNGDGNKDLLVGDSRGNIHIYLKQENKLIYKEKVQAERKNIYGENTIYTGKNVVPFLLDYNGNGKMDLITGQLSFALVYDLTDDNFPYKKELEESLAYAKQHHVPIFPHVYFHSHKDDALEKRELELHQQNFEKLGLKWDYTGTNQHTWRVNIDNPTQSFKNLIEYNIWNNFGFKTPNAPTDPNFGRDYIWPVAFMLAEGEDVLPMVLFTPSPFIRNYGEVYKHLASMDIPLTFFEHIEYKITRGGSGLEHLMSMIKFAQEVRENYNYAFMTEEQMAKAFINTFYTDYEIKMENNHVEVIPDTKNVPKHLAEEYLGTGGIKVELGEKYKGYNLLTDALIQYKQNNQLYVGIGEKVNLYLSQQNKREVENQIEKPVKVLMANSPFTHRWEENQLIIKFQSAGMLQLKLHSDKPLKIDGNDIKVEQQNNIYTITHFGKGLEIKITPKY